MKELLQDKKGIFGLDSVRTFFGILVALAIFLFVFIIVLGTLDDSGVAKGRPLGGTLDNETILFETNGTLVSIFVYEEESFTSGNPVIINSTGGEVIPSTNYTVVGALITAVDSSPYNNSLVNVSGTWTARHAPQTTDILGNTTEGIVSFVDNLSSVFVILAVVVVILVLIVLVRLVAGNKSEESVF